MSDTWLNYQYKIEFSYAGEKKSDGQCSVVGVNTNAVKHGTAAYIETPANGDPVKHYVYGSSYTEPIEITIMLGEGARPWLKWFSEFQNGKKAETRNVTLSLFGYGQDPGTGGTGQLWLRWDLINCYPVSWQIMSFGIADSATPMQVTMQLQFESMVVSDGTQQLSESMG